MQNIAIEKTPVNVGLLDRDLRAALGAKVHGISTGKGKVVVHLNESASQANIEQATTIVNDHDHTATTPVQDAQAAQNSRIAVARASYVGNLLDVPQANLTDALERINWLQDEIERIKSLNSS